MVAELLEEIHRSLRNSLMKTHVDRQQWDSWPQENKSAMEILINRRIRNRLHFPDRLTQIIPTGSLRPGVRV